MINGLIENQVHLVRCFYINMKWKQRINKGDKTMNNFENYAGRYFERNLNREDGEAEVFKIEKFDGEHFVVTEYGLHLGFQHLN